MFLCKNLWVFIQESRTIKRQEILNKELVLLNDFTVMLDNFIGRQFYQILYKRFFIANMSQKQWHTMSFSLKAVQHRCLCQQMSDKIFIKIDLPKWFDVDFGPIDTKTVSELLEMS